MDWGYASYEQTAVALAPISDLVVGFAGIAPGEAVADIATGTGNCALVAARRGATVVGVDPAARLLDVARSRAADEGLAVRFVEGTATGLPLEDDSIDCATSVMGVIFEPDGPAAVAELYRVVRPGGRIVLTGWTPDGPVHRAGALLREAVSDAYPALPGPVGTDWSDEAVLRELFPGCELQRHEAGFTAASPAAWFADQEANHPIWAQLRIVLGTVDGAWESVRERTVGLLTEANEDPDAFYVTSGFWLLRAELPR